METTPNNLVLTLQIIRDLTKNYTIGNNDAIIHDLCCSALGEGTPAIDEFTKRLNTMNTHTDVEIK